jgi:O-antigen ligase
MTDIRDRPFGAGLNSLLADLDALQAARCLTVVATLLVVLVTLAPFADLGDANLGTIGSERTAITYLVFGALAAIAVLLSLSEDIPALKSLLTPVHVCFVGWMIFNIAMSENVSVSLQRFILTASVMCLAILMPLLPATQSLFNRCLGVSALVLLALCYLGILLVPQLAVHSSSDIAEPMLAGDWRGTFSHKNLASPVMTILVYLGIYLTTAGAFLSGPVILIASGIFLLFTGGKTATGLCLVTCALATLVWATKSLWLKRIICFVPLLAMNLLTVGSVLNQRIADLTKLLPIDPTFTGRTDIWEFAFAAFEEKPIVGHGYSAFWDNVASRQTLEGAEWAVSAAHSHNSYLDLLVTIGLPGLILVVMIFVLAPLRNFQTIQDHGSAGSLSRFFLMVWLFGLYYGTTETFLLDRQNPTGFLFVMAVAGLHFLSRFQLRDNAQTLTVT